MPVQRSQKVIFRVVWTWGLSSSSSSFSGWCGCGGLAEQTRKFHHPQSSKRETKVTQDIYVSKSDELSGFPLEIQKSYIFYVGSPYNTMLDIFCKGRGGGTPQFICLLLTKKFNIITILIAAPHFILTTSKTQTLPTNSSLWSISLNPALHRYTSLVRRNFLRFGKRSDGTFPPLASSGERERGEDEMEEGELLPPFEGEQQEPHLVVEGPVKRARNFIRFGRAPARPPALALGEEIKVGVEQFQEKRSLLQGVRERRAGGTRRRMSNFLR